MTTDLFETLMFPIEEPSSLVGSWIPTLNGVFFSFSPKINTFPPRFIIALSTSLDFKYFTIWSAAYPFAIPPKSISIPFLFNFTELFFSSIEISL